MTHLSLSPVEQAALYFLAPLKYTYPDFETWYLTKVVPGKRVGERRLFTKVLDGRIIAAGIAKKTADEKKICTLHTAPAWRTVGIISSMIDSMTSWLECPTPIFSVYYKNKDDFESTIKQQGWINTSFKNNEYIYNEPDMPV